jgi:hypothetical protein
MNKQMNFGQIAEAEITTKLLEQTLSTKSCGLLRSTPNQNGFQSRVIKAGQGKKNISFFFFSYLSSNIVKKVRMYCTWHALQSGASAAPMLMTKMALILT